MIKDFIERAGGKIIGDAELMHASQKALDGERISCEEAELLSHKASLGLLMMLAGEACKRHNSNNVYFIRNFHIEPTNICSYHCLFCSYSQRSHENGAWELTMDDIRRAVNEADPLAAEVHITGGAHPERGIEYYGEIIRMIRSLRADIHIKAFSAVEIHHMHEKCGSSYEEIIKYLIGCGLGSIPGGGAEIFDRELRRRICPEKVDADGWLSVHETAHKLGLPSNATMLYGHIETFTHRIAHMHMLRTLQDKTGGFQAFIPLKFRNMNNRMSGTPEVPLLEDLRNYALARIFLDNIPHIKAYWPMLGKSNAQLSLFFGVDDLDGTIQDSTKIYSLAGVEEGASLSAEEISQMITQAGRTPVERDSLYKPRTL
jgi:aminodeoxyfutalosine synthase